MPERGRSIGTPLRRRPRSPAPRRRSTIAKNCAIDPLDNAARSARVYVLKHRGPRKRRGNRSNPEARAVVVLAGNGGGTIPGTDAEYGGNTVGDGHWSRQQCRRPLRRQPAHAGCRAHDRGAAEQSVRRSGHRGPAESFAGSDGALGRGADGCASGCRRFGVWRISPHATGHHPQRQTSRRRSPLIPSRSPHAF